MTEAFTQRTAEKGRKQELNFSEIFGIQTVGKATIQEVGKDDFLDSLLTNRRQLDENWRMEGTSDGVPTI